MERKNNIIERLNFYSEIINLFIGIYSFPILFFINNFVNNHNKEKNYITISIIVFVIYFLFIYSIMFYGIYTKKNFDDKIVDIVVFSFFLSFPIFIYRFISFFIRFIIDKLKK